MMCAAYAALGVAALIGTQLALLEFVRRSDNGGVAGFIDDAFANPAATFMSLDVTFVALPVFLLMRQLRLASVRT